MRTELSFILASCLPLRQIALALTLVFVTVQLVAQQEAEQGEAEQGEAEQREAEQGEAQQEVAAQETAEQKAATSPASQPQEPPLPERTKAGIALSKPWQQILYGFCRDKLIHSAWGIEHSERDYLLALSIAEREGLSIDRDVLFAAAFLHDVGVYEPYVIEGAEHSATAVDLLSTLLLPTGFPANKLPAVERAILAHMFYATPPTDEQPGATEARVLHDADTLDFLGDIGVARIVSLTTRHRWAPDLSGAHATIKKFQLDLPGKLVTKTARRIARKRVKQSKRYLASVRRQSAAGDAL